MYKIFILGLIIGYGIALLVNYYRGKNK